MKRHRSALLAAFGLAMTVGVFAAQPVAHAGGNPAPTQCIVPAIPNDEVAAADLPSCTEIEGLCIDYQHFAGPSRAVHSASAARALPAGGAVIDPQDDCESFGECGMRVQQPSGPRRAIHTAASRVLPAGGVGIHAPGSVFDIPQSCLDLPDSGFDVAPVLLAGLVVLGAGIAITGARRRFA